MVGNVLISSLAVGVVAVVVDDDNVVSVSVHASVDHQTDHHGHELRGEEG